MAVNLQICPYCHLRSDLGATVCPHCTRTIPIWARLRGMNDNDMVAFFLGLLPLLLVTLVWFGGMFVAVRRHGEISYDGPWPEYYSGVVCSFLFPWCFAIFVATWLNGTMKVRTAMAFLAFPATWFTTIFGGLELRLTEAQRMTDYHWLVPATIISIFFMIIRRF